MLEIGYMKFFTADPVLLRQLKQCVIASSIIGFSFLCGILLFLSTCPVVDFSVLERYDPGKPSILFDNEGKEWGRFQLDRRLPIKLRDMPPQVINAFIAAEDWNFFRHSGVSWKGMVRSALTNLYHGRIVQGASTITQQLIKLLFFDSKRTFKRKLKEQLLAFLVERQFTKEQILETYLNHVYFGSGIYGIEAAAQRFWGVSAKDVSVAQSAMLAAIMRSPGNYSPLYYPLSAEKRRSLVLSQMHKLRFIDRETFQQASSEPLGIKDFCRDDCAPHLKETIRQELEEKFGRHVLYCGGLSIQTTINQVIQKTAQEEFIKHFTTKIHKKISPEVEGALLTMDVQTGAIRALVGGIDFKTSQFNRALQGRRQQGSVFKPILYAAAIDAGISLIDTAIDEPLIVQSESSEWKPRNHHRRHDGPMTLARGLSYSNNIISVKTILAVGPKRVADLAKRFHLTNPLPYPALSLGCIDSTLDQVAGMFNVFAHDGVYVKPYYIKWVKDSLGKKIYRHMPFSERVLSSRTTGQVTKVLGLGMDRKRAMSQEWIDSSSINKTGTTNDSRTCWFAGSTPELTTVVYAGYDDNRAMGSNVYPVHTGFPIWLALHKTISTKKKEFYFDSSLKQVKVNIKTGKLASTSGPDVFSLLV